MIKLTTLNLSPESNRRYFFSRRDAAAAAKLCKSLDVTYIAETVTDQQIVAEHVSQLTCLCQLVGKTYDQTKVGAPTVKEARAALRDEFEEFESWLWGLVESMDTPPAGKHKPTQSADLTMLDLTDKEQ